MSGHVFVVGADLTRLSCDDVLVPTDRSLRVAPSWCPLLPAGLVSGPGDDGACVDLEWSGDERVLEVPGEGDRRTWLVDTVDGGGDGGGDGGLEWLVDGAREALAQVARREVPRAAHGRARRLVGLPALGTGWGGAAGQRGALLQQLLPVLRKAAVEHGFDVALVLRGPSDLAAAQRVRRGADDGWDLPGELRALAEQLGERFGPGSYALAHALIADLPVQEFVTTNYDPLVEQAATDIGRDVRVLPFEEAAPGSPWLLKLHGDAAHPESVVLTREEYLQLGDTRAALAGVLHSLLLTRHVLFVGTSMLDDDLIRIAHQVRSALQPQGPASGRRNGTVLALREDPVRARLWEPDVETVAMGPADLDAADAARRLEVLLDLIGCLSTPPTGYLLDPAYRGLLDAEECALADALGRAADAVHEDSGSAAAQEVAALLRRLGHGAIGGGVRRPVDGSTRVQDDRVQEQRPG